MHGDGGKRREEVEKGRRDISKLDAPWSRRGKDRKGEKERDILIDEVIMGLLRNQP